MDVVKPAEHPVDPAEHMDPNIPPVGPVSEGWVDGTFVIHRNGDGRLCVRAWRWLGWSGEPSPRPWRHRVHPADLSSVERAVSRAWCAPEERFQVECRLRRGDGGWRRVFLCGTVHGDTIDGFVTDLSRMPLDQTRLREALELLDEHVSLLDADFRPVFLTPGLVRLTGMSPDRLASDTRLRWGHPDDSRALRRMGAQLRRTGEATIRWRMRCADGNWRWMETRGHRLDDTSWESARYLCTSRDVHDGVEATALAQWQANHDPLTDLPNRTYFLERVGQALGRIQPGRTLGILFIDLDGFKQINDTLGHGVGDTLLRAVAGRLQEQVRAGDTVARMGGDEFTILLSRLSSPDEGVAIARRLLAALSKPVRCGGRDLFVTASIGGSFHPTDGATAEILLRHADLAMYQAKRRGNRICLFEPVLDQAARERLRIENLLRGGLERREFELHFQPTLRLSTGEIESFEALLRWRNPSSEAPVAPDRLVAQAERTGLMDALGRWIVDTAASQMGRWSPSFPDPVRVSLNVSAIQLASPEFVPHFLEAMARSGVPAHRWELEIAESATLGKERQAIAPLHTLRDKGVRITLDDFGKGFASLGLLRELPLDAVKIDTSLLDTITVCAQSRAVLRSVIELAHALGLEVVAEGVERPEDRDALQELGCDALQGYLIAPPMPASRVTQFLACHTSDNRRTA